MKVASPEESGRIETHENVYFANENYERRSLTPNTGASFQLSDEYGIVEVQVVEMTEAVAIKQASVTTLHVSVV